ncbi:MAG: hypothetical protein KKC18_02695 [Chloroflexi bacterium]|nr:hypothetical protein [Chloroflexota bacterium]
MSKRTIGLISVAAGVLLIALLYGLIVRGVLAQREQQALIEDQIAPLEAALAGQEGGVQVLPTRQTELATLQAELVAAQFAFPIEVDTTEVLAHIVTTAATHRVNLLQLQARDPLTATIGTGTYRIFAYDVETEGTLDTISAFLATLESGPIGTLTLDQMSLEAQPTPPAAYRASLVIRVYVRLAEPDISLLEDGDEE